LNGNWADVSGSGVNISDPSYVDFTGVLPGTYLFTYTIPENGTCLSAEAIITVVVGFGANAGNDGNVFVCEGSSEMVDLYDYLGSTYDLGGSWTQLSGANVSLSDPHNVTFPNKPPGSYNFQYSVSSGCGTDIAIVTVIINPAIGAGEGFLLTLCQNETINLYDSLKNYLQGGYWIDENNNPVVNPLHVALTQIKTYTFKYIFTGSSGCPNDTSISFITTIAGVNAGLNGSLLICFGTQDTVNLFSYIGQGYTPGGSWWYINNGIKTSSDPKIDFSSHPVGLDTFMYVISGSCGNDTSYVFINITTSPSAGDPYNIIVCQNNTVNLFDSLKNYTAGGVWYYEDNSLVSNPKAVKLSEIKLYSFKYIIPASGACLSDTVLVTITTNPAPYAGSGIDFEVCEKNTGAINLFNYLSGSYSLGGIWKLNNNIIPVANNFNYSSLSSGNYIISYIVASSGICPGDTAEIKLNVLKNPNPGNDVSINICEFGQTNVLNFENLIGAHDSGGKWINNYSAFINTSNPNSVNFKTAPEGIYLFYYLIDPNNVCEKDSSEIKISVLGKSFAGIDKSVSYCKGTNIKLSLKNELAPDNNIPYLFKDLNNTGILNTTNGEFNISSLNGGTYKFQIITGIGDFCGTDTSTLEVKIIDLLNAGTNNSLTVCNDETNVNLDQLLGTHDTGGSWIDMDNSGVQVNPSNGKNVSFQSIPKGKYRYQYHHSANSPCPESNAIISVTVNPVTKFTLSREICSGENISINGHTYNLANPAGTEIIPNAFGCDSIITIDLKQKQLSSSVSKIDENCFGVGKFTINNLSGFSFPSTLTIVGNGSYQINSVPFEVSNLSGGIYTYSVTDPNACSDLNKTFEIKTFVPYNINTDVQQFDDSYLLSVTTNIDPQLISWMPKSGLSCSDCLITYAKLLNDQQYIIEIIDKEGCIVRDTVFLNRIVNIKLEIPNIFSPDNDGRNDRFFVKCQDCSGKYNLIIFDRWGEKIFSKENLDFNDNTSGWDGKFKNKYLNPGVFVYLIETKSDNGESNYYSGDVLLIK
jgi:gliding motility-associated-like protein